MPEGDTIWRAATALREHIAGHEVLAAEPGTLARVKGSRVDEVEATGKHLVIRFDNDLVLHTHMRMTGAWHIYRVGERWRQPAHSARAVLRFRDCVAVLFSAPVVELVAAEHLKLDHLGPDILEPGFDPDDAVRRARLIESPTLGEMLLDQRVAAGIGNVYKCETLWRLRLDPWLDPAALSDAELRGIFEMARDLMLPNLTGGFARRFPRQGGSPRAAVHGRAGRPCRRCGVPIRLRAQGEQARMTYYCPVCQPSRAAVSRATRAG